MTYRWPTFATAVLVAVLALPVAFVLLLAPASEGACGLSSPPALHGSERDAGGGVFVGGKWHYPEEGGPTWTPAKIAAKAEQYDLPGETFSQIAHGESDYHPYVVQHDAGDGNVGFGFFQFTPNAWGPPGNATQRKLDELGGQRGLEDIEKQSNSRASCTGAPVASARGMHAVRDRLHASRRHGPDRERARRHRLRR